MKPALISLLLFATILFSCKKHGSLPSIPSSYYLEYTVNGIKYRHTNYTAALMISPGRCHVHGLETNAMNANGAKLEIVYGNGLSPLQVGNYSDTAGTSGGAGEFFGTGGTLQHYGKTYITSPLINKTSGMPFRLAVTALNADSVSGTFSGRLYHGGQSTSIDILNGKFCINF